MTNAIVECGIIIPANIGCWAEYQCNKGYHIQLNIQDIISYYVQLLDELLDSSKFTYLWTYYIDLCKW